MTSLTPSDRRREHEASKFWFMVALLRLRLRRGPEQMKLLMENK